MNTIVVWFSCGAASAVAAKQTIDMFGDSVNILIANNPVNEEHGDNLRFLKDVSEWIGKPILQVTNAKYPLASAVEVWTKVKYMSGVKGAPCTKQLKKEARYQFERENKIDYHVLGFTADEINRHNRFVNYERENVLPILIYTETTKMDCFKILSDAGIKPPEIYSLGFPNANCIGCVKSSSPTYWNHVRKVFPEIFKERAELSRKINCRLVKLKGKRIFLDELPIDAKGRPMKTLKSIECGIFCDTK